MLVTEDTADATSLHKMSVSPKCHINETPLSKLDPTLRMDVTSITAYFMFNLAET